MSHVPQQDNIPFTYYTPESVFPQEVLDLNGITNPNLLIDFTNHKEVRSLRRIKPLRRAMWFGSTPYHTEPQWFMHAWDLDKDCERDFPWKNIHSIKIIEYVSTQNLEVKDPKEDNNVEPKV